MSNAAASKLKSKLVNATNLVKKDEQSDPRSGQEFFELAEKVSESSFSEVSCNILTFGGVGPKEAIGIASVPSSI